ncbi:DUF5301 domain-containing protein [Streptococcus entericus]|uniref:DUF5301 domain-containing protein n=1 Tax=Streptococcus entericus TaxID=155680 RepID=UPI000377AF8B|nr:DUF5301 domain-containing protein [Streptococcus entericus]
MKKVVIVLLGLLLAGLVYWQGPGSAPSLPGSGEISAITFSTEKDTAFLVTPDAPLRIEDEETIASFLETLSQSHKTRQKSVNDVPYAERYDRVEMIFKPGQNSAIAYLYPEGRTTYLERPYTGIYKLNIPIDKWLETVN